ncbi:hypothetical protein [Streptomyces eurythermus]|uniref:hypothetical protein n=2 Tax=Streptomyces TaxID=1883 RepID=UPI00167651A8|nr:hypothetical protein [Streptomyces eurythermus]GGR67375.1 hypothetical protein GCM10010236_21650 [Streptomyces eurythermus]
MSRDEDFETGLARALRRTAGEFPPPSADLVRRSVGRGRRKRLAAAVRITAAAAAVVAAGGGLLAAVPLGGHGDGTPERLRTGTQARVTGQPASPKPAPPSGAEMVRTLSGLLPPGGTVSAATGRDGSAGDDIVWPMAKLTYTTARGSTALDVTLTRPTPGVPADQQGQGGCLPVQVRPYDRCATEKLPGGSVLTTVKSFTYPSRDTGQKRWYAVLTAADGAEVTVQEFAGGGEKEASGTADPLLSLAELSAIARSPRWDSALAALPTPPRAPATGVEAVPGDRMTRVLKSHLPHGGTVSDLNADDGLVQLVYDDGHGRNMVEADAQYDMADALAGHMGCAGVAGDCRSEALGDGTRVKTVRGRSEKGGSAQVWQVDVLYPDGRRVVAREVNSYAEAGPVTRPRPALGLELLRAVALDKAFFTG